MHGRILAAGFCFASLGGGCTSAVDVPPVSADAATDTAAPPADTRPTCAQNGATACNDYVSIYCARISLCCNAGGSCTSACKDTTGGGDSCTATNCKARSIKNGLDCSTSRFTSKTVCAETTKACTDQIPLIPCSDILAGTAGLPPSCRTFLEQFPL